MSDTWLLRFGHEPFLRWLPFAVMGVVGVIDILAGPGYGYLPLLAVGERWAATARTRARERTDDRRGRSAGAAATGAAMGGPVQIVVSYTSAAARIGGDLYEVVKTRSGIRILVGDG